MTRPHLDGPVRIASLVPSITEALCLLGLEDALVGITDYCTHPADIVDGKTRIGGTKDPDLAAIRALAPDLIIANTDEQRAATLDELEALGVDVLVTTTDSIDDVLETWTQLGRVTDREMTAEHERERIIEARERARERIGDRTHLTTLVPIWRSPWMATGGRTYIADLLATCGFTNLLRDLPERWARIVLSTDPAQASVVNKGPAKGQTIYTLPKLPDVVLLPSEPYAFADRDRDAFVALGTPRHAIRLVDGELLTWWLSRTAEALEHFSLLYDEMAPLVHRA